MPGSIRWFALLAFLLAAACAGAQELDASLNESVVMVGKKLLLGSVDLETTLYKPAGDGPFPIVVINHGKAPGDPRFQSRYRPVVAVRYFLARGYAVVVPMRQGFAHSTGTYNSVQCNVGSNGLVQAEDVRAVLDYVTAQAWADRTRVLVVGQSHGGWTTLAFGTLDYPGVKGLVNFAGGLRNESCTAWKDGLIGAAGGYGRDTHVPSLWFYGDNDSYFDAYTFRGMLEKYTAAGGPARLVAFGTFGSDSHLLFGVRAGAPIWQPEVTRFLAALGLPSAPLAETDAVVIPIPPRSDFAAIGDDAKVPYVRDGGRTGYRVFLGKRPPRAFAIAPNGGWGWAAGGEDAPERALANCSRRAAAACRLYAVDDYTVWKDAP